jgi:hypothetical protein
MKYSETKNYDDVMKYLKDKYNIHRSNVATDFYGKKVRPEQTPKMPVIIKYINENMKDFKEFTAEYMNISEPLGCGKRSFTDEESRKWLSRCLLSFNSSRKESRRYFCKKCDAWHLTSQPNKKITG